MRRLVLAALLAISTAVAAQTDGADKTGFVPNPGLTGSWFNPDQNGHGFIFEFIDDTTVLAYWFTFDPDGNRTWLFGVGTVVDKEFDLPLLYLNSDTGDSDGAPLSPGTYQLHVKWKTYGPSRAPFGFGGSSRSHQALLSFLIE